MGLLDDIKENFAVDCLYKVLGVPKDCTCSDLKKGYYRKSLQCHPDKAGIDKAQKEQLTRKFQTLSKCYDILKDEEKRKIYDETGAVDDSYAAVEDWVDYWRILFPKVTGEQIQIFMSEYRDSETEKEDLKKIYELHKGDLDKICLYHLAYEMEDEDRICALLEGMIKAGAIKDYAAFSKETAQRKRNRKSRFMAEAKEAKKLKEEEDVDLAALIVSAQKKRSADFLAKMEAKYAPKPKSRKKNGKK